MKKFLCLFILITLVVSLIAGCGNAGPEKTEGATAAQTTESNTGKTEADSENTARYSGNVHIFANSWIFKDNPARIEEYNKKLKEKFGFELKVTNPPYENSKEKLNTMLSSGEDIDIIWGSSPLDMLSLADKGFLLPFTKYLENNKYFNQENWLGMPYLDAVSYKDEVYAIPYTKALTYVPVINKVWLDKLNLPVPQTFDELEKALKAFKDNKLGGETTIPLAHQWANADQIASFLGMFGVPSANLMIDDNNKVTHPWLSQQALDGITWLARMYSEKILDMDFPTTQEESFRQKMVNGMIGMAYDWAASIDQMNEKAGAAGGKAFMIPIDQLSYKEGVKPTLIGNTLCLWMLSKTSKNPDAAVALLEYWTTPEAANFFTMKEGEDWTMKDGKKFFDEAKANLVVYAFRELTVIKNWQESVPLAEQGVKGAAIMDKYMSYPAGVANAALAADIAKEEALKAIVGTQSPEDFQKNLKDRLLAKKLID